MAKILDSLNWLKERREFVSVSAIEKRLGMSNGTLWKAIKGDRGLSYRYQSGLDSIVAYLRGGVVVEQITEKASGVIDKIPDKLKEKVTMAIDMADWFLIDNVPKYKAEGFDTKYYQGKWYAKRK